MTGAKKYIASYFIQPLLLFQNVIHFSGEITCKVIVHYLETCWFKLFLS